MQGLASRSLAQRAGVLVRGPGTGTSDSIPAALSDGELVIPADDVRRYGAAQIMAAVKQGGQDLPRPSLHDGIAHAATGGLMTDPYGPQSSNVTRAGNSYSGGNIGGAITVNGQAPRGTFSTYGAQPSSLASRALGSPSVAGAAAPSTGTGLASRALATPTMQTPGTAAGAQPGTAGAPGMQGAASPPPQPSGLAVIGNPANQQVRSIFAPPASPQPSASRPGGPAPNSLAAAAMGWPGGAAGGRIGWTGQQQTADGAAGRSLAARPMAMAQQPGADATQPFYPGTALGYARGGLVDEEDLPLATQAQVRAVDNTPRSLAAMAYPGRLLPGGNEQAQVRAVDNGPANAAAIAAAPTASMPLAQRALGGRSSILSAEPMPPSQIELANRAAAQSRSLASIALGQANQGIGVPATPGLGVIGPADYANRNADFNDSAQLRTILARGAAPGRNGAAAFQQQVQGAAMPLVQRAQQQEAAAKNATDLQREQLQQQGVATQAAMQDRRMAEATGIQRERLQFEQAREDRADTAAREEQARKARIAQIDELIVSGTPEQRKAAAAQKAALMGRGMDEVGKVGEVSTGIRKEFEGLPEVKNYKQALPAYRGIIDAAQRNTPMSDINLVYGIAKLYDPNSVVREGEYSTVANAPGMPDRIKGWAQYVAGGGKLTPEVKQQIVAEANSRMGTFDKEYGTVIGRYGDIARRSGADASLVVPQDYLPLAQQQQAEQSARMAELRRRAANNPQLAQRLQQMGL